LDGLSLAYKGLFYSSISAVRSLSRGPPRVGPFSDAPYAHYAFTGLVVIADPLFAAERARLAELALAHRLPSAFSRRENAQAGALLSYGPNLGAQFRRAAGYAAKILRGAAPADLPVEQPTHLELVLNLRTAKALELSLPPSLLIRADEVIE